MLTCSDLDVLTDDVRGYTLSFTLASTLRCLSMTSHSCKPFISGEKTIDILCCEEDNLELLQKLVTSGHVPTERHIEVAAENGSFLVFNFLRSAVNCGFNSITDNTRLRQERFDKHLQYFDNIETNVVEAELEASRKQCRDLNLSESYAEKWYGHHQFSFAANMYLVESGARLLYYCDLYSTCEMHAVLIQAIGSANIGVLVCVPFPGGAPGIFRRDSTNQVYAHLGDKEENVLALTFGYGYTGPDYERMENMYLVSFDIARGNERAIQLYGYKCPVEAYSDSIRDFDLEKLKLFRKHLTPLGVRVEYTLIRI